VHRVTLKNTSKAKKSAQLFSFIEFCLWDAADDQNNYQRNLSIGEVEVVGSTIYHKTEYRERRNHYAIYSVNAKVVGFDTDRESFIGLWNGFGEPQVVAEGKSRNSVASGWSPIGSHQLDVPLAPARRGPSSSCSGTSRTRWRRSSRSRASSTRSRPRRCSPASRPASRWTPRWRPCASTGPRCCRSTR